MEKPSTGTNDRSRHIQNPTKLVQGELKSIGDELVMNLNTNEYTLGENEDTMAKRYFIAIIWLIAPSVFALPEDRNQPIEIAVDNAVINEKQNQAEQQALFS